MKHIILILTLIISTNIHGQISSTTNNTRNDFLGTWEWQNGNETFRVNFFNEDNGDGTFSLAGHYKMVEVINGNEVELYTSNRPIVSGNTQMYPPAIAGGHYFDWIDTYRFFFQDNTSITQRAPSLGDLKLKFLNTQPNEPLQVSWKLRVEGMANEDEQFSVPTDIILTKSE